MGVFRSRSSRVTCSGSSEHIVKASKVYETLEALALSSHNPRDCRTVDNTYCKV